MPPSVELSDLSGQIQILGLAAAVAMLLRWKLASSKLTNTAQ
jgi:hypothetical protein